MQPTNPLSVIYATLTLIFKCFIAILCLEIMYSVHTLFTCKILTHVNIYIQLTYTVLLIQMNEEQIIQEFALDGVVT